MSTKNKDVQMEETLIHLDNNFSQHVSIQLKNLGAACIYEILLSEVIKKPGGHILALKSL